MISVAHAEDPGFDEIPFAELARAAGHDAPVADLPVVCVQGLGFVGAAMAIAVGDARGPDGAPCFNVAGVDLPTPDGLAKIEAINAGRLPVDASDDALRRGARRGERPRQPRRDDRRARVRARLGDARRPAARRAGRRRAPAVRVDGFRAAIRTLGQPHAAGLARDRGDDGPAGDDREARRARAGRGARRARAAARTRSGSPTPTSASCPARATWTRSCGSRAATRGTRRPPPTRARPSSPRSSTSTSIPLTRLSSTTACETAKVLENSYRATLIAFMEEWGRFAEATGVDLFEVIGADPPAPDPREHAPARVRRRRLLPHQGPAARAGLGARPVRPRGARLPVLAARRRGQPGDAAGEHPPARGAARAARPRRARRSR